MALPSATRQGLLGIRVGKSLRVSRQFLLRALLVSGCVVATIVAASLGSAESRVAVDDDLARLLRGMALIKATLVLAAVGVVSWRFGHPVSQRIAAVYLCGTWLAAAASMLVWQLAFLPLAAIAFHAAGIAVLVAAWRDGIARSRPV